METAWPSGKGAGLEIQRSRVQVPAWPLCWRARGLVRRCFDVFKMSAEWTIDFCSRELFEAIMFIISQREISFRCLV